MPGDFELAAPVEGELRRGPGSPLALDTTLPLANATFQVGDACNLEAAELGAPFDAVLMANLICRVPDPVKALRDLSQANGGEGIVKKGGVVMLVTPFSWDTSFTAKDNWLGGKSGAEDSFEGLQAALGEEFELVDQFRIPLVIREHRRRWQYIVPDGAVFKRVK